MNDSEFNECAKSSVNKLIERSPEKKITPFNNSISLDLEPCQNTSFTGFIDTNMVENDREANKGDDENWPSKEPASKLKYL